MLIFDLSCQQSSHELRESASANSEVTNVTLGLGALQARKQRERATLDVDPSKIVTDKRVKTS